MSDKRAHNLRPLVTGEARFSGESEYLANFLYAYPVVSPVPRGKLISVDFSPIENLFGVVGHFVASDIPGENAIGAIKRVEEPLLAFDTVEYIGQPVGVVLATDAETARRAARLVSVVVEPLKPILTLREAILKEQYYEAPLTVASGNLEEGYGKSFSVIEGSFESQGQEHAYIETQRAFAMKGEHGVGVKIHCGTQAVTDIQEVVALLLKVPVNRIEVDVDRVGGAFGGKERGGTMWAGIAALGLYMSGKNCAVILDRSDDLAWTGKRHPYISDYRVGFDEKGRISAFEVDMYANGGFFEDFTVAIMERAVLGICGPYFLPNTRITGYCCQTNLPANTAFRGFGAPQATLVMEAIIADIAQHLGLPVMEIQKANFIQDGQKTPYDMVLEEVAIPQIYETLMTDCEYPSLKASCDAFNKAHRYKKRGIGIVPVKYGIGFTATFLNQGNALVYVYSDGSVSVSHGGIDMGQGLYTKVEMIVAQTLGVSEESVHCESTNTKRIGCVASTAASTGTDLNGEAARMACTEIRSVLEKAAAKFLEEKYQLAAAPNYIEFKDGLWWDVRMASEKQTFASLASYCYFNRCNLGAQAHYATPGLCYDILKGKGTPFSYFTNGVCLSEVEIDTLTGTYSLLQVHLRHEGGNILDYEIDRGQVVGGFMQGLGFVTMEDIQHSPKGKSLATSFSTYKVPLFSDVPPVLEVHLVPSNDKIAGVLGSKGVGEPPLIYGVSVFNALRDAVEAVGNHTKKADLLHPATPQRVLEAIEAQK
jgi:xanthine dehydrogenase large subunit